MIAAASPNAALNVSAGQPTKDEIEALASDLWASVHPDEKWAVVNFTRRASFYQSARLGLAP